jgi:hypothetical protein
VKEFLGESQEQKRCHENTKITGTILLLLFLLLAFITSEAGRAANVESEPIREPSGLVLLVVDGLGSSYIYPEHRAYALDGSPLEGAVLFNLSGSGARAVDVQVPVPETTQSHSVLITGRADVDPGHPGKTVFDAAREDGFLCLGLLQRGDAMPVLQEMDAVLYLDDNSLHGAEPIPGFRAGAAASLSPILQRWRDRFGRYTGEPGTLAYINYNAWALDAAADLVDNLSGRKFIMLVNAGGADSAGHELGAEGYRETVAALDEPLGKLAETCRKKHVLLVVTADHGMVFPGKEGKGGHSAEKYADRLEARRVPLVFLGPGVEELNLGGSWSETDIAPTLLSLLNISADLEGNGKEMPVAESFRLAVSGAPEDLTLWQGEERLAEGSAGQCIFWGLSRGAYALRAGEKEWPVTVNGDVAVDLGRPGLGEGWKKLIGVVLILAINLVGIAAIVRIWRKG